MTRRALVLSGGGPVGIAWETGVVAGLAKAGVRLADADLIVGTSAGSVVGAQIALGRDPAAMYEAQRQAAASAATARAEAPSGPPDLGGLMQVMMKAAAEDRPLEERLRDVGTFALNAQTADEEAFVRGFATRFEGVDSWPAKDFRCTAIDAATGRFVVWDRESGVPLSRAVASSCAVPGIFPPITIGGSRYYDGGIRSASNADLAAGAETVVLISLIAGDTASSDPRAEIARRRVEGEISALREAGARAVEVLGPNAAAREAFGPNLMDGRRNAAAADHGFRLGEAESARIGQVWN
jgi:NTE family protein